MKKLISLLLLCAMLASTLASCALNRDQLDPSQYLQEGISENTAYTSQTAWNGSTSDTSWYTANTSATTFSLSDGADLKGFITLISQGTTFEGKTVQLAKDINLGNKTWTIPTSSNYFKGTFDGKGYTIGGFKMTCTTGNQSLLGAVGGSAIIKNLNVEGGAITIRASATANAAAGVISRVVTEADKTVKVVSVTSSCTFSYNSNSSAFTRIGGIIGSVEGAGALEVTDCKNTGKISSRKGTVGGIIADVENGVTSLTVTGCQNSGAITANDSFSGIVGYINKCYNITVSISDCTNTGALTVYEDSNSGNLAGILGRCNMSGSLSVSNCDNTGAITLAGQENKIGLWTGGIVGYVYGIDTSNPITSLTIEDCNSTGDIEGNRTSGGIAGFLQRVSKLTISNCIVDANLTFIINDNTYTTAGLLNNRYAGGLVGAIHMINSSSSATISDCSVNGTLHVWEPHEQNSRIGGLIGMIRNSAVNATNCQINLRFSTRDLEDDDIINMTVGGFESSSTKPIATNDTVKIIPTNVTYYWFDDIATKESYLSLNNTTAYFKAIGHQYRYNAQSNTYDLRYVFGVNNLQSTDNGIGFEVAAKLLGDTVENRDIKVYCPTVFSSIAADGVSYTASEFGCEYLFTLTIANIPASEIELTTLDGTSAAFSKNTVLDITPFTTENATASVNKGSGVVNHTYEPTRHTFQQEDFTPYLPAAFQGLTGVISSEGVSYSPAVNLTCHNYKQLGSNDQYVLQEDCTCGGNCTWSANAAVAYRLNENVPYHYYIDEASYNSKFNPDISDRYEAYHTWTFTVDEDGYYDFCFRIRLAGTNGGTQTRYALVQFDNEAYSQQSEFYYSLVVRDGTMRDNADNCDAYITGYGKYLTAGTHTITFRQPYNGEDGTDKGYSFHIRDIYYYKDAAEPVDANIPLPQGATLYDGNFDNNVTYLLDGTTEAVFNAYRNTLVSNGFSLADYRVTNFQYSDFDVTNTPDDGNYTYTGNYVDDSTYYNYYYIYTNADYMLNVYFCTATGDMRVIVSDIEEYEDYVALNDAAETTYTAITTPLFAMLDIGGPDLTLTEGTNAGQTVSGVTNGLCLVYRLSDGRFVIVDGGYWNDKDTEGEGIKRLYDWLQEHADYDGDGNYANNQITIAAWLITHHHSDHIHGAWKFAQMYRDTGLVEVQNYLYNFPSYEYAMSNFGTNLSPSMYTMYYPKLHSMLGASNTNTLVAHSGMVYNFADISIEILFTHEDFYPNKLQIYNNSSTIFKITLAGKSFLVAGDLQEDGQIKAIKKCGTLLESDFLQVTHHGFNGQVEFYKYIVGQDASGNFNTDTIIIWPLPQGESSSLFDGTAARAVANRWLKELFRNENDLATDNLYYSKENWEFSDFPRRVIPTFTDADFSTEMNFTPTITVEGSNCETGVTYTQTVTPNKQYHLFTNGIDTGASANSVVKLNAGVTKTIYHYYISAGASGYADAGMGKQSNSTAYIRFSFKVTEAGTYEIYSYMRIKSADTRLGIVRIDNQTPMEVGYSLTNKVDDGEAGAYMHWDGATVYLEAGTHTLTYQLPSGSSWHFRTLYFVKK